MIHSSLTPELFSPAQIEFLRRLGVRVEYCGSNQSAFSEDCGATGHEGEK